MNDDTATRLTFAALKPICVKVMGLIVAATNINTASSSSNAQQHQRLSSTPLEDLLRQLLRTDTLVSSSSSGDDDEADAAAAHQCLLRKGMPRCVDYVLIPLVMLLPSQSRYVGEGERDQRNIASSSSSSTPPSPSLLIPDRMIEVVFRCITGLFLSAGAAAFCTEPSTSTSTPTTAASNRITQLNSSRSDQENDNDDDDDTSSGTSDRVSDILQKVFIIINDAIEGRRRRRTGEKGSVIAETQQNSSSVSGIPVLVSEETLIAALDVWWSICSHVGGIGAEAIDVEGKQQTEGEGKDIQKGDVSFDNNKDHGNDTAAAALTTTTTNAPFLSTRDRVLIQACEELLDDSLDDDDDGGGGDDDVTTFTGRGSSSSNITFSSSSTESPSSLSQQQQQQLQRSRLIAKHHQLGTQATANGILLKPSRLVLSSSSSSIDIYGKSRNTTATYTTSSFRGAPYQSTIPTILAHDTISSHAASLFINIIIGTGSSSSSGSYSRNTRIAAVRALTAMVGCLASAPTQTTSMLTPTSSAHVEAESKREDTAPAPSLPLLRLTPSPSAIATFLPGVITALLQVLVPPPSSSSLGIASTSASTSTSTSTSSSSLPGSALIASCTHALATLLELCFTDQVKQQSLLFSPSSSSSSPPPAFSPSKIGSPCDNPSWWLHTTPRICQVIAILASNAALKISPLLLLQSDTETTSSRNSKETKEKDDNVIVKAYMRLFRDVIQEQCKETLAPLSTTAVCDVVCLLSDANTSRETGRNSKEKEVDIQTQQTQQQQQQQRECSLNILACSFIRLPLILQSLPRVVSSAAAAAPKYNEASNSSISTTSMLHMQQVWDALTSYMEGKGMEAVLKLLADEEKDSGVGSGSTGDDGRTIVGDTTPTTPTSSTTPVSSQVSSLSFCVWDAMCSSSSSSSSSSSASLQYLRLLQRRIDDSYIHMNSSSSSVSSSFASSLGVKAHNLVSAIVKKQQASASSSSSLTSTTPTTTTNNTLNFSIAESISYIVSLTCEVVPPSCWYFLPDAAPLLPLRSMSGRRKRTSSSPSKVVFTFPTPPLWAVADKEALNTRIEEQAPLSRNMHHLDTDTDDISSSYSSSSSSISPLIITNTTSTYTSSSSRSTWGAVVKPLDTELLSSLANFYSSSTFLERGVDVHTLKDLYAVTLRKAQLERSNCSRSSSNNKSSFTTTPTTITTPTTPTTTILSNVWIASLFMEGSGRILRRHASLLLFLYTQAKTLGTTNNARQRTEQQQKQQQQQQQLALTKQWADIVASFATSGIETCLSLLSEYSKHVPRSTSSSSSSFSNNNNTTTNASNKRQQQVPERVEVTALLLAQICRLLAACCLSVGFSTLPFFLPRVLPPLLSLSTDPFWRQYSCTYTAAQTALELIAYLDNKNNKNRGGKLGGKEDGKNNDIEEEEDDEKDEKDDSAMVETLVTRLLPLPKPVISPVATKLLVRKSDTVAKRASALVSTSNNSSSSNNNNTSSNSRSTSIIVISDAVSSFSPLVQTMFALHSPSIADTVVNKLRSLSQYISSSTTDIENESRDDDDDSISSSSSSSSSSVLTLLHAPRIASLLVASIATTEQKRLALLEEEQEDQEDSQRIATGTSSSSFNDNRNIVSASIPLLQDVTSALRQALDSLASSSNTGSRLFNTSTSSSSLLENKALFYGSSRQQQLLVAEQLEAQQSLSLCIDVIRAIDTSISAMSVVASDRKVGVVYSRGYDEDGNNNSSNSDDDGDGDGSKQSSCSGNSDTQQTATLSVPTFSRSLRQVLSLLGVTPTKSSVGTYKNDNRTPTATPTSAPPYSPPSPSPSPLPHPHKEIRDAIQQLPYLSLPARDVIVRCMISASRHVATASSSFTRENEEDIDTSSSSSSHNKNHHEGIREMKYLQLRLTLTCLSTLLGGCEALARHPDTLFPLLSTLWPNMMMLLPSPTFASERMEDVLEAFYGDDDDEEEEEEKKRKGKGESSSGSGSDVSTSTVGDLVPHKQQQQGPSTKDILVEKTRAFMRLRAQALTRSRRNGRDEEENKEVVEGLDDDGETDDRESNFALISSSSSKSGKTTRRNTKLRGSHSFSLSSNAHQVEVRTLSLTGGMENNEDDTTDNNGSGVHSSSSSFVREVSSASALGTWLSATERDRAILSGDLYKRQLLSQGQKSTNKNRNHSMMTNSNSTSSSSSLSGLTLLAHAAALEFSCALAGAPTRMNIQRSNMTTGSSSGRTTTFSTTPILLRGACAGDFLRSRFISDVWPRLRAVLLSFVGNIQQLRREKVTEDKTFSSPSPSKGTTERITPLYQLYLTALRCIYRLSLPLVSIERDPIELSGGQEGETPGNGMVSGTTSSSNANNYVPAVPYGSDDSTTTVSGTLSSSSPSSSSSSIVPSVLKSTSFKMTSRFTITAPLIRPIVWEATRIVCSIQHHLRHLLLHSTAQPPQPSSSSPSTHHHHHHHHSVHYLLPQQLVEAVDIAVCELQKVDAHVVWDNK